jgi:hypothetical protein
MQGKPMSSEHDAQGNVFEVEQHESLPEVLERLHAYRGESLTLAIADHSPILLTATEFRALKDLADRQHLRLSVRTQDSLRLQLASMFGLAQAPTRAQEAESSEAADGDAEGFGSWRNVRRPKHRPAGQPPELPTLEDVTAASDAADPIAVSRRRRNAIYRDSVSIDDDSDFVRIDDAGLDYIDDDGDRVSRAWLYGRVAAVALVIVALLGAALWYWYPSVEVDVTLRQADVSTEIVYSVAVPGAQIPSDAAFAVEASEQTADVPFTIEVPATGVEREPDGTASGTLVFRNVGDAPVTLDQGTELTTVGGASYMLLEAVEVPAGDLDNPGEAEAPVTASAPGAGGNVDAGGLTGKVPDQDVYYSNLTGAIAGGTDKEYAVVADADVAEAERQVKEDLGEASAKGWESQLPDGMAIVAPSVTPAEPNYTIEGAAGDRRDSVVVTGTVSVTGYVYSIADVEKQARSSFEVALQDQVPPGYALLPDTIDLGDPEVIAEAPQNVDYRVDATAIARAVFDEGAQDGLREQLAGKSVDDAEATLNGIGAIEAWERSHSPGWWPDRMPQSAGRITLNIRPVDTGGGAGETASPVATPSPEPAS